MDGIERARGDTPSQIYLVVWQRMYGTQEYIAAIDGLNLAVLKYLPNRNRKLANIATGSIAIAFILGTLYGYVLVPLRKKLPFREMAVSIFITLSVAATYWYVEQAIRLLPITDTPKLDIAVLSALSSFIGFYLYRQRYFSFQMERKNTIQMNQSRT